MQQYLKQYTHYRAPVTSPGVNKGRIGILPKGRYYGFDILQPDSQSSPNNPTVLLGHNHKLRFTDGDGIKEVGVAITPHGVVIHSHTPIPISIPENNTAGVRYGALVMQLNWSSQVPHNNPTFFIEMTGTSIPTYANLDEKTDVLLGWVEIEPGASSHADITLHSSPTPFFGDQDLNSHFSRLKVQNIFQSFNGAKKTLITDSDISYSGGGGAYFLSLTGTNYNEIKLNAKTQTINYIIPPPSFQGRDNYLIIGVKIKSDSGGTITFKGGEGLTNLDIEGDITFSPGDSFLLYGNGAGWSIVSSFSKLKRLINQNQSDLTEITETIHPLVTQTTLVDTKNETFFSGSGKTLIWYDLNIIKVGRVYRIKGKFKFTDELSVSLNNLFLANVEIPIPGAQPLFPVTINGELDLSEGVSEDSGYLSKVFSVYLGGVGQDNPQLRLLPNLYNIQVIQTSGLEILFNKTILV
jgi:hypothetical protein